MKGAFESIAYYVDGKVYAKVCIFCGKCKNIEEFPKNGKDAAGNVVHRQDCKTCYNIRRVANKKDNKKSHSDFIGGQKRRGEEEPQLSHQEWKECLIFFGGECAYCGCTANKGQKMTRDHLSALSKGGKTIQSNIIPACKSCNSSKGAEDFREWYMKQPFFSQERLNRVFKWRAIIRQVEDMT